MIKNFITLPFYYNILNIILQKKDDYAIILTNTKENQMKKIILKFLKRNKWLLLIQTIFIFLNIYFAIYPARIVGELVDLLYDIPANQELIIEKTVYLLIISVVLLIVRIPWRFLVSYLSRVLEQNLEDELFKNLLKLKMNEIQNIKNGEIMSYFTKDIGEIRKAFYRIASYGTRIIATFLIATFTMAQGVNINLTIITMLPIIVTAYLVVKIKEYVEKSFQISQVHYTNLSEYVQESTDAIRTTKAYSQEGNQLKTFITKNRKLKSANNTVDANSTLLSVCINICFGLCYGISIIYGSQLVLNQTISIGDFVAFNGYINLFVGPISWLPVTIAYYKRGKISYGRIEKFLELEKEKIVPMLDTQREQIGEKIQISHLDFHYPNCDEEVLKNINITITQGETLGIIGKVGSGKTTLMNLLLRLYSVPNGMIKIGEKDINDIPIENIRKNICYITQDHFLFSDTIEKNISLFQRNYREEDVITSAKKAMIYDEIQEMNNGIYTIIGERGIDLSGGQKQRVSISRAFFNQANIIILDDTFSALDNKTEKEVLKNVKEMTKNKICIIISNRISDVKDAEHIIVLDEGEIIEEGTHEELIGKYGSYYQFYQNQIEQSNFN